MMKPREDSCSIMDRRVRLKAVNSYLTCHLCNGYLIDATTIIECLHTFCKACIVKYLEENVNCPKCHLLIHHSHPLNYISYDRTMQDIVYKLVPRLQEEEMARRKQFYEKRGLPIPRLSVSANSVVKSPSSPAVVVETNSSDSDSDAKQLVTSPADDDNDDVVMAMDLYPGDDQVNLCLVSAAGDGEDAKVEQRYIRCSNLATVTQLQKFVSLKLFGCLDRHEEIDMFCNNELLGKDHTLKFIFLTCCKVRDVTLRLEYRPHAATSDLDLES